MPNPQRITINVNLTEVTLPDKKQYLYLFEAVGTGLVKVGITSNIKSRTSHIVGANAVEVRLIGVMEAPQGKKDEDALKELLCEKGLHAHGEWFRDCEEVRMLFL